MQEGLTGRQFHDLYQIETCLLYTSKREKSIPHAAVICRVLQVTQRQSERSQSSCIQISSNQKLLEYEEFPAWEVPFFGENMKSEISKKSDRETGRFIGTLLMVLLLIAAVTTISVTLGAIHVSPDEIVKILANKTSGKDIFAVSWEQKTENIKMCIRDRAARMKFGEI